MALKQHLKQVYFLFFSKLLTLGGEAFNCIPGRQGLNRLYIEISRDLHELSKVYGANGKKMRDIGHGPVCPWSEGEPVHLMSPQRTCLPSGVVPSTLTLDLARGFLWPMGNQ